LIEARNQKFESVFVRFKSDNIFMAYGLKGQLIRARAATKYVACVSAFLVCTAASPIAAAASSGVSATVMRVIDGDTIWVQTSSNSKPLKVRIQSIDAPEICQDGGIAARNALKAHVLGRSVMLFAKATDDFQRTVARVDLQGDDIGRWMVAGGHAWSLGAFDSGGPYRVEQQTAQQSRRGFFSRSEPEHPKDFRKRHGSCYLR
jgi:micrococcal nuclease